MNRPEEWIEQLGLLPHPEGGFYKEVYRSAVTIAKNALPADFGGERVISTSIYYLLKAGERSGFHRIKSDEAWHFYDGFPLELLIISPQGELTKKSIGIHPEKGLFPQLTIPAGHWFAAHSLGEFSLLGCTVAPGFDFVDFEMADREKLRIEFPQHQEIIDRFTSV